MRRFLPIFLVLLLCVQSAWIGAAIVVPHAAAAPAQAAPEAAPQAIPLTMPAAHPHEPPPGELPCGNACGSCHLPLPTVTCGVAVLTNPPALRAVTMAPLHVPASFDPDRPDKPQWRLCA